MFRSMRRRLSGGSRRRSVKRNNSNNKRNNSNNSNNGQKVTFSAKLAVFILEGLKSKPKLDGNDSHMQPEVSGAIPYLHMNIKKNDVVKKFKETQSKRISGLSKICKSRGLEKTLKSVGFQCNTQSKNGVISINKSIVDSINNRWAMRDNGRAHLKVIGEYMMGQVERGEIPKSSLNWCRGGKDLKYC
tara:strand:- start:5459 stop:6022 length:564 start_codon:yes stop_codon:yes gene_type:complete